MTSSDGPVPAGTWIAFLRARVDDERSLAQAATAASGWWEPSGPGIAVDGRILTKVFTGHGAAADHDVALHLACQQPVRVLDDLDAKERLLELCERQRDRLDAGLLAVLVQFAEPFRDHPEHPDQSPVEEP
ncbi:hypothetical protein Snoj_27830 [Streptomyces nojiriensis]|uniref:Uncharacterized protein n=1 Tax=Streptomyces nojiriensis TaxID=66374 RepID=A0ABQ3SM12_9ACTN|nr:DUF6221 family protein [Streptomyces nojiriensis]QTI42464.1 hypothetical protein JYK04_00222 [Streptomyces nojiriensis]GGS38236.1 hypothetical protein GCM10010205_80040 [Streptomyces nojiriensis]GHI68865.1 hypothetical protein Snoj_27830 [Streptomyces nojiriensis]